MNYLLLPDLAAMAMLLSILYFLRQRHPRETVDLWLIGLVFIFFEAIIHAAYPPPGTLRTVAHVVNLNFFYIAGAIFLWASGRDLFSRRLYLLYLLINSLPPVALLTIYGLNIRVPAAYHGVAACGFVVGIVSAAAIAHKWTVRRVWWTLFLQFGTWIPIWLFASAESFRDAAYFVLFVIYFSTAVLFQLSLPRKSLGKVAIVIGFVIWSLVFLLHSWVTNHPGYDPIADEIWNLQKFLVTIGMLLVLLEQQVSTNEWYAFHDHLTGLPNKRLFEERLTTAVQGSNLNNTRTALLMVDLDGFKLINDTQGHDAGDEVLRQVAKNLLSAIRPPDTLARFGGDEFTLIATDLPGGEPAEIIAQTAAARIDRALRKPVNINGNTLNLSGSIGVAIYPDDTTDESLLCRLADQRMYEQKRQIPLHF
ncbi:MAG TPA: GGDEF domain-containing protein [Edaphobacter sp.]|nr:GGDEF domain-containing protein [Edaphobacter sp.]